MIENTTNGVSLWRFERLSRYHEVLHFVSGRAGGCSEPPHHTLNLGFGGGDQPRRVAENRRRLSEALGIPWESLVTVRQVHGADVTVVETPAGHQVADGSAQIPRACDAMITNVSGICLMILVADCVPLLFYDPLLRAVGAAHAGWKGTVLGIARETVEALRCRFGSRAEDIVVGVGPSIGPCCYEVGPEVVAQVKEAFPGREDLIQRRGAKSTPHFDLWAANRIRLIEAGIREENIEIAGLCTYDHSERFFSYRLDQGATGRFGAGIVIR